MKGGAHMEKNAYQLLSMGARYWFVLLAALVVWRAGMYLLREHYRRRKILKKLPDAGMVGELRDMQNNRAYPLAREGVLGGGRGCDIRLRGLKRRHVNFAFVEGRGLLLTPCHSRSEIQLDGVNLGKGGYALHGAVLHVGGYTLRVRLFAGLNVPHPAAFQDHWQRAYEDELYAPETAAFTAVPVGYAPYPETVYENEAVDMAQPYEDYEEEAPADAYRQVATMVHATERYEPNQMAAAYAPQTYQPVYSAPVPEDEEDDEPQAFAGGVYGQGDEVDNRQEEQAYLPVQPRYERRRRSDRRRQG